MTPDFSLTLLLLGAMIIFPPPMPATPISWYDDLLERAGCDGCFEHDGASYAA